MWKILSSLAFAAVKIHNWCCAWVSLRLSRCRCWFGGQCSPCFPPQGGAHEGLQHLGPFGNIPNIVAELTGDNVPKDLSDDHGYPDPPNPCPLGKTGRCFRRKHITGMLISQNDKMTQIFSSFSVRASSHSQQQTAAWKRLLTQLSSAGSFRNTSTYLTQSMTTQPWQSGWVHSWTGTNLYLFITDQRSCKKNHFLHLVL